MTDGITELKSQQDDLESRVAVLEAAQRQFLNASSGYRGQLKHLEAMMGIRFDGVDGQFDAFGVIVKDRFWSLGMRLDTFNARFGKIDARIDTLETRVNTRFDKVEADISGIKTDISGIKQGVQEILRRLGPPPGSDKNASQN